MNGKSRFIKAINSFIKNDAVSSAVASFLTDRDCSEEDLIAIEEFKNNAIALLPIISANSTKKGFFEKHFLNLTDGRTIFIICGVSASGKDTLASYAKHSLYLGGKEFSYTRKYTTRSRRGYEGRTNIESFSEPSGNYQYFSNEKEFEEIQDAVMDYSLYKHLYALSGNFLDSKNLRNTNQMCIYGKFENIREIRQKMFINHKRLPFTILIKAPIEDCEARILRRHSMSASEQNRRIKEMKRQSLFIDKNQDIIESSFDIVIENGDSTSVAENANLFTEFVSRRIEWSKNLLSQL